MTEQGRGRTSIRAPRRRSPVRLVTGAVIAALVVWFVAVNTQSTHIRLWIPTVTAPLWIVLAVALVLGTLVGTVFAGRVIRRRR